MDRRKNMELLYRGTMDDMSGEAFQIASVIIKDSLFAYSKMKKDIFLEDMQLLIGIVTMGFIDQLLRVFYLL